METAEHYAKTLMYALQLGQPVRLNGDQIASLLKIREQLGIDGGEMPMPNYL